MKTTYHVYTEVIAASWSDDLKMDEPIETKTITSYHILATTEIAEAEGLADKLLEHGALLSENAEHEIDMEKPEEWR